MQACRFRSLPGTGRWAPAGLLGASMRDRLRELRRSFRHDGVPSGLMGGQLERLLRRAYGPGVSVDAWLEGRLGNDTPLEPIRVEHPDTAAGDLEAALAARGDCNPLLREDLELLGDALEDRHRSLQLVVDHCQLDDQGRFFLSAFARTVMHPAVRVGDSLLGGVDVMGDAESGRLVVRSRIVRQVCSNGAVVPGHRGMGSVMYVRQPDGTREGRLEDIVRRSFAPRLLERATTGLRAAALTPVREPVTTLAGYGLYLRPDQVEQVRAIFERDRDPTLYGAFNALTETARDERDDAERRRLEREAGSLLVAFLRLAPASDPARVSAPLAADTSLVADTAGSVLGGAFDPPTAPV